MTTCNAICRRFVPALAAIVLLAGCTSTITEAEPVKEKQTAVHCDLIFPPVSVVP